MRVIARRMGGAGIENGRCGQDVGDRRGEEGGHSSRTRCRRTTAMKNGAPLGRPRAPPGMGFRRALWATPGSVGPGRYVPEASANPSNKTNMPRWTLPKAGRPDAAPKKYDKN